MDYSNLFSYIKFPFEDTIPIETIKSYHSHERALFSRMVFNLGLDHVRSMELIALWIWLQERNPIDIITAINKFDDDTIRSISLAGVVLLEALRIDTPLYECELGFHQNAVRGIKYYLRSVCLKAFGDLIENVVEEAANPRRMDQLIDQLNLVFVDMGPVAMASNMSLGEGTSRGEIRREEGNSLTFADVESVIRVGYPLKGVATQPTVLRRVSPIVTNPNPNLRPIYGPNPNPNLLPNLIRNPFPTLIPNHIRFSIDPGCGVHPIFPRQRRSTISEMQCPVIPEITLPIIPELNQQIIPEMDIPIEERTLFVTFSNGYPLTEGELHSFFMR